MRVKGSAGPMGALSSVVEDMASSRQLRDGHTLSAKVVVVAPGGQKVVKARFQDR